MPKIIGANGSWGTVNTESAKIPLRNVEGLEQELKDVKMHRECQSETNVTIWKFIDKHKLELDVFKSAQTEQNNTILEYINKIKALLIVLHILILGLVIFDLGVVWYIIKH
jgi:hypothetical protein